ncbi:hypothetical protein EHS25_004830 [Saitozyma podzolica]|uniref:Uncharacterized protein n=1 Tax=Saitozyma podzolica TaxID=1890683 RepID=A0A427Y2T0_9TREE|nr:hypothetical protein EHS25_004830 [Saitozyma podzolica]
MLPVLLRSEPDADTDVEVPPIGAEPLLGALCLRFFFLGSELSGDVSPALPAAAVDRDRSGKGFAGGRGGSGKPGSVMTAMPSRWRGSAESNLAGRMTTGSLAAMGKWNA